MLTQTLKILRPKRIEISVLLFILFIFDKLNLINLVQYLLQIKFYLSIKTKFKTIKITNHSTMYGFHSIMTFIV